MKYFSFILALFFFALAFVPCSDGYTCDGEQHAADHSHADDEKDHCTPLCVCTCCGVTYTVPELEEFDMDSGAALANYHFNEFTYTNIYSFSFQSTIWHPPSTC